MEILRAAAIGSGSLAALGLTFVAVKFVSPRKITPPPALTGLADLAPGASTDELCAAFLACAEQMDAAQRKYLVRVRRVPQGPHWRTQLMSRWALEAIQEVNLRCAEPGSPDRMSAMQRILAVASRAGSEADQAKLGLGLLRGYDALAFSAVLPRHLFAALYAPLDTVVPLPPHLRTLPPDFGCYIRSVGGRRPVPQTA
ncbi:MAG TPA: hypothetical protein VFJ82_10305 [Longimicrobium sp.]|nr:hypothetical protein [Longimicrobium sp.]